MSQSVSKHTIGSRRNSISRPTSAKSMASFKGGNRLTERTHTSTIISRSHIPKPNPFLNQPTTPPSIKVDSSGEIHNVDPPIEQNQNFIDVDDDQLSSTTEPELVDTGSDTVSTTSSVVNIVTSTPLPATKSEQLAINNMRNRSVLEFDETFGDSIEATRKETTVEGTVEQFSFESDETWDMSTLVPPSEPIEDIGSTLMAPMGTETFNVDSQAEPKIIKRSTFGNRMKFAFKFLFVVLFVTSLIGLVNICGRILMLEQEMEELRAFVSDHVKNYPIGRPLRTALVPYKYFWTSLIFYLHNLWINLFVHFMGIFETN